MERVVKALKNTAIIYLLVGFVMITNAYAINMDTSWAQDLWKYISDIWTKFLGKLVALGALVATAGFLISRRFFEALLAFIAFLICALTTDLLQSVFGG